MFTLLLLCGAAEGICRLIWPEELRDSCIVDDPVHGSRNRPNCTSRTKLPEGPWIENSYNECGYRTSRPCGPKAVGGFRIVLLGSSLVGGWGVPYSQSVPALSSSALSRICGRDIEVLNVSAPANLLNFYRHRGEALDLNPDLVVLVLGPTDIQANLDPGEMAHRDDWQLKKAATAERADSRLRRLQSVLLGNSRAVLVAKHFLYRNPDFYMKILAVHREDSDYMMVPAPASWKRRLADADVIIDEMARDFRGHHVSFALLPAPGQSQALLLSSRQAVPGLDPREFDRSLANIAQSHGVVPLSVSEEFSKVAYADLFYNADGHPSAAGNQLLNQGLTRQLLKESLVPNCKL